MTPRTNRTGTAPVPPPGEHGFSLISKQTLVGLYTTMLQCRLLDRRIREKELAPLPRTRGREAVAAGVTANLKTGDRVYAIDGDVLPRFAQGGIAAFVRAARETKTEHRAMWQDALANARVLKSDKSTDVAALFCGMVSPPAEVLRSAGAERLPVLFVCHENQPQNKSFEAVDGKFPVIPVDCEDAVAIYRVAAEALAHARRGNGPTLIACKRWKLAGGEDAGRGSNAISAMQRYLAGKGLWTPQLKTETLEKFARELENL